MPHERLRPDWTQRAFRYWVKPKEIPQWTWDIAKEMQVTWNSLVSLRDQTFEQTKDMDKAKKKEIWEAFWLSANNFIKESSLNWEAKAEMSDRFKVAHRKAIKQKAHLRHSTGLRRILIPHRYTAGGMKGEDLFDNKGYRCKITLPDQSAYESKDRAHQRQRLTRGSFGIGKDENESVFFKILLHRLLPKGCFIKKICWSGDFDRRRPVGRQWEWWLVITVEEKPVEIKRRDTKSCAIDLGWRIMAEGAYVRIGMIVDSDGNEIELRLPLAYRQKWKKPKEGWLTTYYDLIELSEKAGKAVENCKETLKVQLDKLPPGFVKMRNRGLKELQSNLDPESDAYKTIAAWIEEDKRYWCIYQGLDRKLRQRRTAWYRKLASWLSQHYRAIVWEGDLSLKDMSENTGGNYALQNAAHYRVWAGLYDFRRFLKEAAKKNAAILIDEKSAFTTMPCYIDNSLMQPSSGLVVECERGHRHDQDINAAHNLLMFGRKSDMFPTECKENKRSQHAQNGLEIPEWLRAVAVINEK